MKNKYSQLKKILSKYGCNVCQGKGFMRSIRSNRNWVSDQVNTDYTFQICYPCAGTGFAILYTGNNLTKIVKITDDLLNELYKLLSKANE